MKYACLLFVLFLIACKSGYFSKKDVRHAQKLYGLEFSNQAIDTMYPYLIRNRVGYDSLRSYKIPNSIGPALVFVPHPKGFEVPVGRDSMIINLSRTIERPESDDQLAFYSIVDLGSLIRSGQLTSIELTNIYLKRLKRHNATLKCAITITEDLALLQARIADEELAGGIDRGLLHGIPYGTKDLMSVKGYPTTWGAMPFKDQVIESDAAVIQKLESAGAVLIAKLTSGALARGDVWFGGQTVSPWDTLLGASGSSAGSASATAAGLVGFALGTETLGSITSPSNRNGLSGHRPTYGSVSRKGVMSLSWSMDKVGPMCRSAIDCAVVFDIIREESTVFPNLHMPPFKFDDQLDISSLKIGYLKDLIDQDTSDAGDHIRTLLDLMATKGLQLDSISLPENFPFDAFDIILRAESGAFFDELVQSGAVDKMVEQGQRSRANSLRQSRFIPAVEYLQANRYRSMLIEEVHDLFKNYDIILSPTFGGRQLLITNLTGHPVVTIPIGFDKEHHPTSISILGNLYEDGKILSFGHIIQQWTDYHKQVPPLFAR